MISWKEAKQKFNFPNNNFSKKHHTNTLCSLGEDAETDTYIQYPCFEVLEDTHMFVGPPFNAYMTLDEIKEQVPKLYDKYLIYLAKKV